MAGLGQQSTDKALREPAHPRLEKQNGSRPDSLALSSALLLTLGILILAVYLVLRLTGGTFVYGLDDAYIHLSIARSFARTGVWGISPLQPVSASSSPLWTAILSLFMAVGESALIPLCVNFVLSLTFVWLAFRLSRPWLPNPWHAAAFSMLLFLALPGPAMVLNGMEHVLHALFTLAFIYGLIVWSADDKGVARPDRRWIWFGSLAVIGFFMVLTRYESLFLLGVSAVWGVWKRKPVLAGPLAGGLVGVVLFGLLSVRAGMPFVPAALLLKTDVPESQGLRGFLHVNLLHLEFNPLRGPTFTLLLLGGFLVFRDFWKRLPEVRLALGAVLAASILHVALASVRSVYRYESYLVAALTFVMAYGWVRFGSQRPKWAIAGSVVALGALLCRAAFGFVYAPQASQNIHDQQFQMARFLAGSYRGRTIAMNDIGAASYYSGCRIVDLFGLASPAVLKMKLARTYNGQSMERLLEDSHVDAAIVYPDWFEDYGGLPSNLHAVATWTSQEPNVACSRPSVSFLAPTDKTPELKADLQRFEPELPPRVEADYAR